jgi:hypothetical protein
MQTAALLLAVLPLPLPVCLLDVDQRFVLVTGTYAAAMVSVFHATTLGAELRVFVLGGAVPVFGLGSVLLNRDEDLAAFCSLPHLQYTAFRFAL